MSGKFPISVRFLSKQDPKEPDLVSVIPKKAVKTAVRRSLLRRRLRVILGPFLNKNKTLKVFAAAGSDKLSFSELRDGLTKKDHERNI